MLEGMIVPDNIATQRARDIYNVFSVPRHPDDLGLHFVKDEVQCVHCTQHKIKTKYPKYLMKPIKRYRKIKSGGIREITQYLCPACAAKYTPNEKRVGGRNH